MGVGSVTFDMEDYLKRLRDNELIWAKRDSQVTVLNFWKNPFLCERCGKETHFTSQAYSYYGPHHPVCKECYKELHAYHVAAVRSVDPDAA